jgi:predicted N-acetyltransferase YhbS
MTAIWKAAALASDVVPLAIRAERASDVVARERLLDATFGDNRHARTCQRLRDGRKPAEGLAFSALRGGKLIGTVRLWHVSAGGIPALMLGPLAVDASCRKLGAGAALMTRALDVARARGHGAVFLLGDEAYYSRFGFSAGKTGHLALPGPFERERLLAVELGAGALEHASGLIVPTGALTPGARIHRARKILPPVSRAAKRTTTGALTSLRIVLPWNDDVERLQ